jgi:hypothetical protein
VRRFAGAYTVIALLEAGSNFTRFFRGWTMIVIYENPVMKSRVTLLMVMPM